MDITLVPKVPSSTAHGTCLRACHRSRSQVSLTLVGECDGHRTVLGGNGVGQTSWPQPRRRSVLRVTRIGDMEVKGFWQITTLCTHQTAPERDRTIK